MFKTGDHSRKEIAQAFGISPDTVTVILRRHGLVQRPGWHKLGDTQIVKKLAGGDHG